MVDRTTSARSERIVVISSCLRTSIIGHAFPEVIGILANAIPSSRTISRSEVPIHSSMIEPLMMMPGLRNPSVVANERGK
jgi:hypothetical protein